MWAVILSLGLWLSGLGALVGAAEAPLLRLVWTDAQGLGRSIEPLVRAHLARELHGAELAVDWTSWDGAARDVREGEIRIIVSDLPSGSTPANALGAARVDGRSRWITTYLGNVRRTLRLDPRAHAPLAGAARQLLARAVTRILLHELVHTGRPERPHDDAGLMAASVGRRHLVAPSLPMEPALTAALRDAAEAPATSKAVAAAVVEEDAAR
jgi:hypothetical protein